MLISHPNVLKMNMDVPDQMTEGPKVLWSSGAITFTTWSLTALQTGKTSGEGTQV